MTVPLETARLLLREWKESDLEPFAALNADPEVMRYFPSALSRAESDEMVQRIREHFVKHGFGLFALERKQTGEFIGFTGLAVPSFTAHFTPCVEIGWRLARGHWGKGYATEAAREALQFGFKERRLPEIVSFTAKVNTPSIRVMERIGMRRDPKDDFDHPKVPEGHWLRGHVLWRKNLAF